MQLPDKDLYIEDLKIEDQVLLETSTEQVIEDVLSRGSYLYNTVEFHGTHDADTGDVSLLLDFHAVWNDGPIEQTFVAAARPALLDQVQRWLLQQSSLPLDTDVTVKVSGQSKRSPLVVAHWVLLHAEGRTLPNMGGSYPLRDATTEDLMRAKLLLSLADIDDDEYDVKGRLQIFLNSPPDGEATCSGCGDEEGWSCDCSDPLIFSERGMGGIDRFNQMFDNLMETT